MLGAVGELQFEVVKYRLESEYGVAVRLSPALYALSRWVAESDGRPLDDDVLVSAPLGRPMRDIRGRSVLLFDNEWQLMKAKETWPQRQFTEKAGAVG